MLPRSRVAKQTPRGETDWLGWGGVGWGGIPPTSLSAAASEKKEYFQKSPKKARVIDDKTTPVLQGPGGSIKLPRGEFLLIDPPEGVRYFSLTVF